MLALFVTHGRALIAYLGGSVAMYDDREGVIGHVPGPDALLLKFQNHLLCEHGGRGCRHGEASQSRVSLLASDHRWRRVTAGAQDYESQNSTGMDRGGSWKGLNKWGHKTDRVQCVETQNRKAGQAERPAGHRRESRASPSAPLRF